MKSVYFVEDCSVLTPKKAIKGSTMPNIECWLDPSVPDAVFVSTRGSGTQRLVIEWVDLTYGQMAYFICDCGYRALRLYFPPNTSRFACRMCHKLKYRLSSLNTGSVAGQSIHQFEMMNKLADTRANMSRIFYRGQYTHRFNRFLAQCSKAGFNDVVNDARNLLSLIKSQEITTNAGY